MSETGKDSPKVTIPTTRPEDIIGRLNARAAVVMGVEDVETMIAQRTAAAVAEREPQRELNRKTMGQRAVEAAETAARVQTQLKIGKTAVSPEVLTGIMI